MADYECPKCGIGYDASGVHADDIGERECEICGFTFIVEIEYEPIYSVACKVHAFGDKVTHPLGHYRTCKLCQQIKLNT